MAKVTVEIEIPDGHEIARGPTLEWSGPAIVEATGLDDKSRAIGFSVYTRPAKPLIICGKPADWPEWLDCDWIARDKGGMLSGFRNVEPERNANFWYTRSPGAEYQISCIDIDIPGPWEQSLRENPWRNK